MCATGGGAHFVEGKDRSVGVKSLCRGKDRSSGERSSVGGKVVRRGGGGGGGGSFVTKQTFHPQAEISSASRNFVRKQKFRPQGDILSPCGLSLSMWYLPYLTLTKQKDSLTNFSQIT